MIQPHGGQLVLRQATSQEASSYQQSLQSMFKLPIDNRTASHCEMIAIGGYSPLEGFMTQQQALSVIQNMALPDGLIWAIPILLPVNSDLIQQVPVGEEIALIAPNNQLIATMQVTETFSLDLDEYTQNIFKTTSVEHPGVKYVKQAGNNFIAGPINLINRPQRENIAEPYFMDPAQTRQLFEERQWKKIVAFQTRNPIHRAHEYLIKCALESCDGALIHPLVGETKDDDIPADVRMRCYEALLNNYFNPATVLLSVLPAPMNYAGPREAIHHMILRKNYGCTHMIIGRDHAGVGSYYGTYEAQDLVNDVSDQLGIIPINFEHAVYSKKCEGMVTPKTSPNLSDDDIVFLSGSKVRELLRAGIRPPKEFTREEIADILIEWARQEQCLDSKA